jgi:hypothetical protein
MSAIGRNATQLAAKHPLPVFDTRLSFTERTHAYYLDGRRFAGPSVTTLLKKLFPQDPFNGPLIVEKNLASWRKNKASRYHALVKHKNDTEATEAILAEWKRANELGTFLHRLAELYLNGVPEETIPDSVATEYAYLLKWLENNPDLEPYRTELSVFGKNEKDDVVVVGQADALFRNKRTGAYVLVDFKRVEKDLSPGAPAFGRMGVGIMRGIDAIDFYKYSIQAWLYAVCIERSTDIVIDDCLLLQLHPSLPSYECKQCRDFRAQAEMILDELK